MNSLTIAYVTARRDPKIEWFFDSLRRYVVGEPFQLIIVDLGQKELQRGANQAGFTCTLTGPKPNVWQGEYRLTKEDWFAMANARNTALCLCQTDWIAYVDDLSVLMPSWLMAVKDAMAGNYIVAGAYRKVKDLVVENGEVKSFTPCSEDCRLKLYPNEVSNCKGGELYGCSCAFPVEALLDVGGWPEMCDGLGSEDYCLGIALANKCYTIKYDKRMMTYEAEDLHGHWFNEKGEKVGTVLRRSDKGISPKDKSHALLNIAKQSTYFPNYTEGGIRALRELVLSGKPFPIIQEPKHDFFDGQAISEMT